VQFLKAKFEFCKDCLLYKKIFITKFINILQNMFIPELAVGLFRMVLDPLLKYRAVDLSSRPPPPKKNSFTNNGKLALILAFSSQKTPPDNDSQVSLMPLSHDALLTLQSQ
jgi:hypothetical protein